MGGEAEARNWPAVCALLRPHPAFAALSVEALCVSQGAACSEGRSVVSCAVEQDEESFPARF